MNKYLLVMLSALAAGCGGSGDVAINTYGEDYIEKQIPAEDVEDGWTITYSKFLIALSDIEIANGDEEGAVSVEQRIFDMSQAGPHRVTTLTELDAKRWNDVRIIVKPSVSAVAGNASAEDVAMMNTAGSSVYVEGSGTKGSITKSFKWRFATSTHLHECEDDTAALGIVVPSGGTADIQFTIHGDHLFYDGLQNPDAVVRFDAIADSDANTDGEVTLEELAMTDLTDPASTASAYDTGGAGNVNDLRAFVEALSRTLVHYQGEGECVITN